jgi:transposase
MVDGILILIPTLRSRHVSLRPSVGDGAAFSSYPTYLARQTRAAYPGHTHGFGRHPLGAEVRGPLEGSAPSPLSRLPDLPPLFSKVVFLARFRKDSSALGPRRRGHGLDQVPGGIHRCHLRPGQKRGTCTGWTRIGKGNKVMAVADCHGRPIALCVGSAGQGETTLAPQTIEGILTETRPTALVGDKAYDSRPLHERLRAQGINLIAPHQGAHTHHFQDGRGLRRLKRRYKVERLFAWMKNYRRLRVRWETKVENFAGFVWLAGMLVLFRAYL